MNFQIPSLHTLKKSLLHLIGFIAFFLISFIGVSQNIDDNFPVIRSNKNNDGTYSLIHFAPEKGLKKPLNLSSENLKSILGLPASHELKLPPLKILDANSEIVYEEYFKGIPLAFTRVKVQANGGQIKSIAGRYYLVPEITSVTPKITENAALENALTFMDAKKYSWETDLRNEPELKIRPKGELVLIENHLTASNQSLNNQSFILCYKFKIYAIEPLRFDEVYVDAIKGNVVFINPIIKHGEGIADTRYSGQKSINTILYGGKFVLADTNKISPFETLNLRNGYNFSAATLFSDTDNQWSASEYNNPTLDNAAFDAHWGAAKTFEFLKTKFNRNGFDGKGSPLKSYVHAGNLYNNAFWDGFGVTFGDGDGVNYGPFTSIDICAHEIAHGLCQYSANLIYSNESGAINESLSDIWGACIKHFAAPEKNHWLSGDEINLKNSFFRSFSNPKSKTQPDTYKGTNWYTGDFDNGGVHINSGVMNHWFYMLVTGKTGTNDNGFNYLVEGIGIEKAAAIVYRAETEYLYPTAQMIDARIATLVAAIDLYGENAMETLQVKNAWDAAGVTENLPVPRNLIIEDSIQYIQLKWEFPGFVPDFNGFIIERQTGIDGSFEEISRVIPETLIFKDFNFTPDSLLTYRIMAYNETMVSDTTIGFISHGNGPLVMQTGIYSVCNEQFLDPGGPLNYQNNTTVITTFRPAEPGKKLGVRFLKFSLGPYDYLEIFNGSNTNTQFFGYYSGKNLPPILKSTDTSGALTFRFRSDYFTNDLGWVAEIGCLENMVTRPVLDSVTFDLSKGNVNIFWSDLSDTESGYIIERAVNDSGKQSFTEIGRVGQNITSFRDTTYPLHSTLFYRVSAKYNVDTATSNFKWIQSGDQPFIMNHGMMVGSCNKTFLDPGGLGKYPVPIVNTSQVAVFIPTKIDSKVELNFSRFKLNSSDYLKIYDGWGTDKPVIGTFIGYNSQKPTIIRSTSDDGRLTVEFFRYSYNYGDSGWVANVGCYPFISNPLLLSITPIGNPAKEVQLTWIDRSDIEESYIVQRAINDSTKNAFETISILPPNSTNYTDTLTINDAVYFYRIIGTSKGDSTKSLIMEYNAGNYPILMANNMEFITCEKTFMDPGGLGLYAKNQQYTTIKSTFAPENPGDKLMVSFSSIKLGNEDFLRVYEGGNNSNTQIGFLSKSTTTPAFFKSASADGKLTFAFSRSMYGTNDSGWIAKIKCYKPVQKPVIDSVVKATTQGAKIYWKESGNATSYVIQRSINDSTPRYMKTIGTVLGDIKFFEDTSSIANAWFFYRIIAANEFDSAISSNKGMLIGNAPLSMVDGTKLISCDATLLDPGGIGNYQDVEQGTWPKMVLYPDGPDKKLTLDFELLDLDPNDFVRVFDGNNNLYDYMIGEFTSGSPLPPKLISKSKDGILTIIFERNSALAMPGNWMAKIGCYTPSVLSPKLDTVFLANGKMKISWTDRSENETSFIIQRALNDSTPASFETIAIPAANETTFADSTYPLNGHLFYRVGAINGVDTVFSKVFQTKIGRLPIVMNDLRVITSCDAVLLDPSGLGGNSKIPTNSRFTTVIKPNKINTISEINFSKFLVNQRDQLDVYNGASESWDSLQDSYNMGYLPPPIIRSQSSTGILTLVFRSQTYPEASSSHGWIANITCYKPIRRPEWVTGNLTAANNISIKWKNTPDDETQYMVQHAVNQPNFEPDSFIAIRPANDTIFLHSSPHANAVNFYRVASIRGSDTAWSDVFSLAIGDAPLISGKDTVVVTCDEVFMDPGGIGKYPAPKLWQGIVTTFIPGISGKKIGIDFTSFKLYWSDAIEIFNGGSTDYANSIKRFHGHGPEKPGKIFSKSPDGKLTIRFTRQIDNLPDSGWEARVFCYEEINRPTNPIVKRAGENKFTINFIDNSDNEDGFVLEKCTGDCTNFVPVDTLAPDITEFIDTVPTMISQVRYRIRAIKENYGSDYSDLAILMKENGPLNMCNANVSFSSLDFYDSGGPNYYYNNNENFEVKFYPLDVEKKVKISFESFSTDSQNDYVQIFDRAHTDANRIGLLSGTYYNNYPSFLSKSPEGSLRFTFNSNNGFSNPGWKAKISTTYGLQSPYSFSASVNTDSLVVLNWIDSNQVAVQFILESSYNDSFHFAPIAILPANTFSYIDSNFIPATKAYYRLTASFSDEKSNFSQLVTVNSGTPCNSPFVPTQSAKTVSYVNLLLNNLIDINCKLIARIESVNFSPINLKKVEASVWITDSFPSFNGVNYGKRHYKIIPEVDYPGTSYWLTLFFTQDEFDEYNKQANGKLLPTYPGDINRYKNIRILSAGSSSIELQTPDSYPLPPTEVSVITENIFFNSMLNAYQVRLLMTGPAAAYFLASANDTIYTSCRADAEFVSVQSNKTGYTYQWQKEVQGGFQDLQDDVNFKNTRSNVLQFRKGSLPDGAKIRCMVFYSPSKTFVIENEEMEWIGVADSLWTNPANWSCGKVPGPENRVRIKPGTAHLPVISSNIILKDLIVFPGAKISISDGIQVLLTN